MITQVRNFFKRESYPDFQNEWDNPENTVYREFYITNSHDFEILHDLVKEHMSDKGNEGVARYRLMKILMDESNRAFYLMYQKRTHPLTWLLKWRLQRIKEIFHRRFKTKKFKLQVDLSRIAKEVVTKMNASEFS